MKRTLILMFALILIGSFAVAQSNTGTVIQDGNTNEAFIDQLGQANQGSIHQTRSGSKGYITQDGLDNQSTIRQDNWGSYAIAETEQYGNGNRAFQTQWTIGSGKADSEIYQQGNNNWATQQVGTKQSPGQSVLHEAEIKQIGNGNHAFQFQRAPSTAGGLKNYAYSSQVGDGNNFVLTCSNALDALDLAGLPAAGAYSQYQWGDGHWASLDILGDDNNTAQYQRGDKLVGHTSTILITGNNNQAATGQIGAVPGTASITQTGNGNCAGIQQSGVIVQ